MIPVFAEAAVGITIRHYELDDAGPLLGAALESVSEVGPWLPWCHSGLTLADVRRWIESQIAARKARTAFEFAILDAAGSYLGGCGINGIREPHRFANLGYWVRSSGTGRGVAPAAVMAAARWAFDNTDLERLEIVCAVGNVRSQQVAIKAGARREGVLRSRLHLHDQAHDAVIFSLVRTDILPCPKAPGEATDDR